MFKALVALSVLWSSWGIAGVPIFRSSDFKKLDDLLPTMYYIASESKTPCQGVYRGVEYYGDESSPVMTPQNEILAIVCTRFLKVLMMEGTGILADRGQGELTVNWAGEGRFLPVGKCSWGLGVQGKCLLPYYTIAADLQVYAVNTLIYIPSAKGLVLPNGDKHNGYFLVRDTGGAFRGIGGKRVDLFTALDPDNNNPFSRAGFHHRRPEKAFVVTGNTKNRILREFALKFGELF